MIFDADTYQNLTVPAVYDELSHIREFIVDNADEYGFDSATANRLALAVDETCTNLIKHAFRKNPQYLISISIDKKDDFFAVIIKDKAEPFDMNSVGKVNLPDYFRKMKSGGLGIQIIKTVIDEIQYYSSREVEGDENILVLKKYK